MKKITKVLLIATASALILLLFVAFLPSRFVMPVEGTSNKVAAGKITACSMIPVEIRLGKPM